MFLHALWQRGLQVGQLGIFNTVRSTILGVMRSISRKLPGFLLGKAST